MWVVCKLFPRKLSKNNVFLTSDRAKMKCLMSDIKIEQLTKEKDFQHISQNKIQQEKHQAKVIQRLVVRHIR